MTEGTPLRPPAGAAEGAPGGAVFLGVEAAYDRWAPLYDGMANPMVLAAARILEHGRWRDRARGRAVFEFGCGTGRNLAAFRDAGAARIGGCDLSAGMLAAARSRLPGALLLHADMEGPLPVEPGSVDLALFCLSLEHVADLRPPLAEARRLLRGAGEGQGPESAGRILVVEIHPFLSLAGGRANFTEADGTAIGMPTFPHRFADWLGAFAEVGLGVAACEEWRPLDFGDPPPGPLATLRRGPEAPLAVAFELRAVDRLAPRAGGPIPKTPAGPAAARRLP